MSERPVTSIFDAAILRELRLSAGWLSALFVLTIVAGVLFFVAGAALLFMAGATRRESQLLLGGLLYLTAAFMIHRYRFAVRNVIASPERSTLARAMSRHSFFWCVPVVLVLGTIGIARGVTTGPHAQTSAERATLRNMEATANALEAYALEHHAYPRASSIDELRGILVPRYAAKIEGFDGWKRPFSYRTQCDETSCSAYRLVSGGQDGIDSTSNRVFTEEFIRSLADTEYPLITDDFVHGDGVLMLMPRREVKKP